MIVYKNAPPSHYRRRAAESQKQIVTSRGSQHSDAVPEPMLMFRGASVPWRSSLHASQTFYISSPSVCVVVKKAARP
jgi:hypothetical protein